MRELRVEDALMYLDQVKMEFGDRPHIYNEFLDIMKKFKCQEIDTPGVIQRVSSLFHGNKKLVLGFNTFLPEGYKIELPLDGTTGPVVYRTPGQAGVTAIHVHAPAPGPGPEGRAHSSMAPQQQQPPQQQQSQVAGSAAAAVGRAGMPQPPPHQQSQQQMHPSQGGPGGPSHHHGAAGHQHGPGVQSGQQQQHPPPHGPPGMPGGGPHSSHVHGAPSGHAQMQQQQQGPPSQGSMQRGPAIDQPPAPAPGGGGPYGQQPPPHQQQQQLQMQHAQQVQSAQMQQQQQGHPRQPQQMGRMTSRVDQPSEQNNQPHPSHPPVPGRPSQHQQQQQPPGVVPPTSTSAISNQQPPGAPPPPPSHDTKMSSLPNSRLPPHGAPPHPPQPPPPTSATQNTPPYLSTSVPPPHPSHSRPPPHHPPHQPHPVPPPVPPPQPQQTHTQQPPHPNAPPPQPQPHPPPPQQPVEFDHAINYVTTIKKRFATEPETYKKFLEILHTYQKEQRGIKEVLDEVSRLFADHPDLLKEFTYFLPDAVQAQAKAQLEEVAKIAEARKRAAKAKDAIKSIASTQRQNLQVQSSGNSSVSQGTGQPMGGTSGAGNNNQVVQQRGGGGGGGGPYVPAPAPVPFGATQGRSGDCEREICRNAIYGIVSFAPVRPPRRNELTPSQASFKNGRPRSIPEPPSQPTVSEAAFFERAKAHLKRKELAPDKPAGSRRHTPHAEFLKCLHLYGAGILNKDELILLLRGLFMQGHAPKSGSNAGGAASNPLVANAATELLREFEELLINRGPYAEQERATKDKSKYGSVTSKDYNYSHCEQPTPSYYEYPHDFPYDDFHSHSGQSEMEASVLNSTVVCVGPERRGGSKDRLWMSPEEYDGVKSRRNMYEDALFKVEDEKFEVDMAIDRNISALRAVESMAEEATRLREDEEKDGQPIGRMVYKLRPRSLNSNHIGAIARLYGDSGDEVIQHLMRYPIVVLPIVSKRLREKDTEWRNARTEMLKQWESVRNANYEGSFDVQCYFYRREIERSLASEQLIEECKKARHFAKHPRRQHHHPATDPFAPKFFLNDPNERAILFQPHIKLFGRKDMPHKDAYQCVTKLVMNGVAKTNADREKVSRVWGEFIAPWFDLPAHWFYHEMRERIRSDKSSCIVKYAPGQRVRTAFGDGHIISMIEGNPSSTLRYKVKLPYGNAYIRPCAIIHILPSTSKAQYARSGGFMEFVEHPEEKMEGHRSKTLDKRCHLIFGTEKTYIFMRLYFYLVSVLADAKEHLRMISKQGRKQDHRNLGLNSILKSSTDKTLENGSGSKGDSASKNQKQKTYIGYQGLVSALQDYIGGDIDYKTYETSCRVLTKEKVSQLAALPRLIEKCAESLVKVAREDIILSLFDLSQLKHMDPLHLRSQCFGVTSDAIYRIQFQQPLNYISFMYLPMETDLLTTPKSGSLPASGTGNIDHAVGGDEEGNTMNIDEDDDGGGRIDKEQFQPHTKRLKLK